MSVTEGEQAPRRIRPPQTWHNFVSDVRPRPYPARYLDLYDHRLGRLAGSLVGREDCLKSKSNPPGKYNAVCIRLNRRIVRSLSETETRCEARVVHSV